MIALGWLLFITIGFVTYFFLKHYQFHHRHPFRWQNQFPYELSQNRYFQIPFIFVWVFIFIAALSIGYFSQILTILYLPRYQFVSVLFVLWLMSTTLLFWIRPIHGNWFLWFHLLPISFLILLFFYTSFSFYTGPFEQVQTFFPYTSILQGVLQLLLMLNPKLKHWYQLERIEEQNKKPRFQRPMWFVLAYSTWLTMFNGIVWLMLLQVEMLIG